MGSNCLYFVLVILTLGTWKDLTSYCSNLVGRRLTHFKSVFNYRTIKHVANDVRPCPHTLILPDPCQPSCSHMGWPNRSAGRGRSGAGSRDYRWHFPSDMAGGLAEAQIWKSVLRSLFSWFSCATSVFSPLVINLMALVLEPLTPWVGFLSTGCLLPAIRREEDGKFVSFFITGSSDERFMGRRNEDSLKRGQSLCVILSLRGAFPAFSFSAVI